MNPRGYRLTPQQALDIIEDEEDPAEREGRTVALYRRRDGGNYLLGLREDLYFWRSWGYQTMGPLAVTRRQREIAQREGVRGRSLYWYLLTDVEREDGEKQTARR